MIKTTNNVTLYPSRHRVGSKLYQLASKMLTRNISIIPSYEVYDLTISKEKKFIWFRVAKVASRTIFDTLMNQADIKFEALNAHFVHYPPEFYKDYFKFAFVRNPWDRLVSCWKDKVIKRNYYQFSNEELERMQNFAHFVNYVRTINVETCDQHLRLQTSLIDLNNVDFIGRLENFENDLYYVLDHLNIPRVEVNSKNTSSNQTNYRSFYDEELKTIVYEIYKKDINFFNYDF